MIQRPILDMDPKLDLVLERVVDLPPELVWKAWTTPEHLKAWFAPKPWSTPDCTIDLRPGGMFRTVMRSPGGEDFDSTGCFLEVVPQEMLIWTSALGPGYRPLVMDLDRDLPFTGIILLEPAGENGTKYTAIAVHGERGLRERHDAMGFHDGWSTALNQLVEHMKRVEG